LTVEATQTNAFSQHLNLPNPQPVTVGETRNILRERDQDLGTTTAYVTTHFVPSTQSNQPLSSVLPAKSNFLSFLWPESLKNLTDLRSKSLDPLASRLSQLPTEITPQPNDRLEIVVITANGTPLLKRVPVTRSQVEFLAQKILEDLDQPMNVYQRRTQALYRWLFAPIEAELQAQGVDNVLFSLGDGLRSIPWGALYDGEQFLVEKYSLGITPSLSLTDTTYVSLHDRNVLAMGASEFQGQVPLPAVPIELQTIAQQLDSPSYFLNQDFTIANLRQARETLRPGVIHLATHANFQAGDLDDSYIQLWGNEQISLENIDSFQWFTEPPVELLVLSACRTALGDRQAELGFGGLAVKAGVRSALASLWYVSDAGTLALMTEFYRNLHNPEIKTKAEALRQAQVALIRGEITVEAGQLRGGSTRSPYTIPLPESHSSFNSDTLAHPYYWAAFTLIGSPW